MEISCSCSLNLNQAPPMFSSSPMHFRKGGLNPITCRANTLEKLSSVTPNFYKVLSLESEKVGLEEIKKAYRGMARQCHPDVVPASRREESTRRFVEIQRAYETLSDPVARQRYDCQLGLSFFGGKGVRSSPNFDRATWEDQLSGLESRSGSHMRRKRCSR